MTRSTTAAFQRNAKSVIDRSQEGIVRCQRERAGLTSRLARLNDERRAAITAHVERLLEDVRRSNFDPQVLFRITRDEVRDSLSAPILQEAQKARSPKVPLIVWLLGGGDDFREEARRSVLESIETRLRARIGQGELKHRNFEDIRNLDTQIKEAEQQQADLASAERKLRQQIAALEMARQDQRPQRPELVEAVRHSASSRSSASDDDWLTTFLVMQVFTDFAFDSADTPTYQSGFEPAGGDFGGAGAGATWEDTPAGASASPEMSYDSHGAIS